MLEERVRDLLGPNIAVQDVIDAFTIDHSEGGLRFASSAEVSVGVDDASIEVRGRFFLVNGEKRQIGMFMRRFLKREQNLRVYHMEIEMDPPYRLHHIARAHYRKAFQFYVEVGVTNVYMEADRDGPNIWPTFGFELVEQQQQDRLRRLVEEELAKYELALEDVLDVSNLRPVAALLAAIEVDVPTDDGGEENVAVGQIAMKRLYAQIGEPLRMTMWFDQPSAKNYLRELGVVLSQSED